MSGGVIGFTGTRNGMTRDQRIAVRLVLAEFDPSRIAFGLHGDCVGADADFDALCRDFGIETRCRPCTFDGMRARTGAPEIAAPERPMARNRAIVADADMMIACPPNDEPIKSGSGTWATIGFAEKAKKPIVIVYPGGHVECRRLKPEAIRARGDAT